MAIDKLKTTSLEDNSITSDKIASGAVTISDIGDNEISMAKLSQVDLTIAPEVLEIQVDAPDMGQDTMWKWTWEQSTLPYARRTITNSNELNVPLYKEGTYVVNNFAAYDIHGSMTQTHSLYLKWIDGAGTDNLVSWATSAGPISDTHPDINGGNTTDVQRITVNVPATITIPSLTNPSVSYTVVNNASGGYTFSGAAKGDNPNLGPFYRGGTYTVNINATGHPFYFTTDNGTNFSAGTYFGEYTSGVTGSRTDSGTITFTVPANAPDTLYYQCGNHSAMRGAITVKDLAVETNINGNYVVYFQHTQEGHRTPVELRPIPSLVNQMCLVYDNNTNKFVPQDLATYVENTPSFENKIREVAGTAELVVEDGSAVVAKVNVYDDSTYLPLTGNNPGDQAFATDTDILYIWDGTAWQQAGAANSDDLTEGSTNLFFTDERVDDRVSTLIVGGNNITSTYDDTAGTLTIDGQPGYTDSDVGTYLSNNGYDTATNIVASITDSAPATLDTLNELAAALGDDPNFATTTANNIATKLATADFTSTANTWIGTKDTDALSEGSTNLYYTDARADARITASDTDALSEGSTNLYYTQGRFDSAFATKIASDVTFGGAVNAATLSGDGSAITNLTFPVTTNRYSYTATANQTSFTATYTTGSVDVFLNGVKLVRTTDYTDTSGTAIVLTSGVGAGETIEIISYANFSVGDAVSASGGGTFSGNVQVNAGLNVSNNLVLNSSLSMQGTGDFNMDRTDNHFSFTTSAAAQTANRGVIFQLAGGGQSNTRFKVHHATSEFTGNVGIGTDSPARKLHIKDSGQIRLENTSTGGWAGLDIRTSVGTNDYDMYMGMVDSDGRFFIDVNSNGNDLVILQNGNIGIGEPNPAEKLEVNGSVKVGNLKIQNVYGGRIGFNRNTATGAIYDSNYPAFQINGATSTLDYLSFEAYTSAGAGSNAMAITSDGKVAVGLTSDIGSKFNVNSEMSLGPNNNNRMILSTTSGGVGSIGTIKGGSANFGTMTFDGGTVDVDGTFNIQNGVLGLPTHSSHPSGASAGDVYYNSTNQVVFHYTGSVWVQMSNTFTATGGTISTLGGYKLHTFTSNGTFTVTGAGSTNAQVLVVAGGGAGGSGGGQNGGGGGGAGGVIMHPSYNLIAGNYNITVGAGGSAGGNLGAPGNDSIFDNLAAKGGGGGGCNGGPDAASGGSGGGRGRDRGNNYGSATQPSQGGDSGTYGFGNRGGGGAGGGCQSAGGGGGAGSVGYDGAYDCNALQGGATQSDGGHGKQWSINSTYYGAGGGGAIEVSPSQGLGSAGGIGGGGNGGGNYGSSFNATSGSANTGSGGGGGQGGGSAGSGGSGIVIIAYQV